MRGDRVGVCIDLIDLDSNRNTFEENINDSEPGFIGQGEHTNALKDDNVSIDTNITDIIHFPSTYTA